MLARYLWYVVAWLIARFGEEVLEWSVRRVIEYFRDHPEQGKAAYEVAAAKCMSDWETGDDCYFWER